MAMDFSKAPGSKTVSKVLQKNEERANELAKMTVSIDKLIPCKFNSEIYDMDEDELDFLEKGIKEEGFHSTVTVCTTPDTPKGSFVILSGHRRVEAAKRAGEKYLPVIIKPVKDESDMLKILISSNRKNRDDKPLTHAKEIKFYREVIAPAKGIDKNVLDYIASELHLSRGQVAKYESLLHLIPELQALANNPEYAFSAFHKAAQLSTEQQKEVYQQILDEEAKDNEHNSLTRPIIIAIIDAVKEGKKYADIKAEEQQNLSVSQTVPETFLNKPVSDEQKETSNTSGNVKPFDMKQDDQSKEEDTFFDLNSIPAPQESLPTSSEQEEREGEPLDNRFMEDDPDDFYPSRSIDFSIALTSIRSSLENYLYGDEDFDFTQTDKINHEMMLMQKLFDEIRNKMK